MPAITVRTLLRNAGAVFENMERDGEPVLITRHGRPVAALVPVDPEQADAMILSAAPEMIESRRQAEHARAEGRTTSLANLQAELEAMDAEHAVHVTDVSTAADVSAAADIVPSRGRPAARRWRQPSTVGRGVAPAAEQLASLSYLLGADQAAEVGRIASQRAGEITNDALSKATEAGLIEQGNQPEKFAERITRLNARLLLEAVSHTLSRDLLERIAALSAGIAPSTPVTDPAEGILGKSVTDAALGQAATLVSKVNDQVIAGSTAGAKFSPEVMETALTVSIGTLEGVE